MVKNVKNAVSILVMTAMVMISGTAVWAQSTIGSANQVTSNVGARTEEQSGGWTKSSNGRWWYEYSDGQYPKGQVALINGAYYNFDGKGWMTTGWAKLGGYWYFFDRSGGAMQSGWVKDSGHWYYLDENGIMKNGWQYINGAWYYLKSSGSMATGWQYIDGHWYYLKLNGSMATGWQYIDDHWYYLKSNGSMATGWQYIDGHWYYLKSNGAMATGWLKSKGSWYHLIGSGVMETGRISVDGKSYYMSSTGAMQYEYKRYYSKNFGYPQGKEGTNRPVAIVIHHWGADNQRFGGVVNWLTTPASYVSAHYVMENGRVAQLVDHYNSA